MQRWEIQEPQAPPLTEGVFRLLVLFSLAFGIEWIAAAGFQRPIDSLALSFGPDFQPTQILTHIFLVIPPGFFGGLSLFFLCLMLWGFGGDIERLWGPRHFLNLFLAGMAGSLLLGLIAHLSAFPGLSLHGPTGGISAVLLAYAVLWPDRKALFFFVIPMRIRRDILVFAVLIAVSSMVALLQVLGGALGGALFIYYYLRKGNRTYGQSVEDRTMTLSERWEEFKKKRRLNKKKAEIERRIEMKEEVDRLLEKISKSGMKSLSSKEKALLDRASREL